MNSPDSYEYLNIKELLYEIVYSVKHNEYDTAVKIMLENNISIKKLSTLTLKINQIDLAKLADKIIENSE